MHSTATTRLMDHRDYRARVDTFVDSGAERAGAAPAQRPVLAIGEAKAGETAGTGRLTDLERARAALGTRAAQAKLLLFAPEFTPALVALAGRRADLELVDLDRLYYGA